MILFRGPNDSHLNPLPRYHSSAIYSPDQTDQLTSCKIPTWTYPLTKNSKDKFRALLAAYFQGMPPLEAKWLRSYLYAGGPSMGSVVSIWLFIPDNVESQLQIENENHIRVFHRYFHKMTW